MRCVWSLGIRRGVKGGGGGREGAAPEVALGGGGEAGGGAGQVFRRIQAQQLVQPRLHLVPRRIPAPSRAPASLTEAVMQLIVTSEGQAGMKGSIAPFPRPCK